MIIPGGSHLSCVALALLVLPTGVIASACGEDDVPLGEPYRPQPRFAEHIAPPPGPPRVKSDRADALGRPVTVACATCHSLARGEGRFGRPEHVAGEPLTVFHQGLTVTHGELACRSCHEGPDYATLHLADGRSLPFPEVQTLCRQCHGPQARDYAHGTHGGMNGYWDLSRGPRERHACTVCHDPHAPAYPGMMPARGPVDPHQGAH